MMTGKTLIQAINTPEKDFPHICEIPIFLYDAKDRLHTDSNITFEKELFSENFEEKEKVISYLNELEEKKISYIDVKITESHVIIFSKTSNLKIFSRKLN